ncbi:MAG: polysaccharide biosynthesis/export family protein [Rikenellaceae bacterium]
MRSFIFALLALTMSISCATQQKVVYFQDLKIDTLIAHNAGEKVRLRSGDAISIVVSSQDSRLSAVLNLPKIEQIVGSNNPAYANGKTMSYTLDEQGNIDFPVVGLINVDGLTKSEVAKKIKQILIDGEYVLDPVVTVDYANLKFSVMGEVSNPGQYNITEERTTILEALSMAGDLSIYAIRDKVFLTRITPEGRITYKLNLKSTDIYNSPAYYIQQDDLIYAEPNKVRTNQSTANGNSFSSATFWMSVTSLLTTIAVLIFN